jgi:PBP1b-binding outer membrane lipoprotein LpoB
MNRAAGVAACAVFLVGCESMVAPRYSVTGDNNMAMTTRHPTRLFQA